MITKLQSKNFKSLRQFDINPSSLNAIVGANGTGKTNFADLIDFLSKMARNGLREAVKDLGGLQKIRTQSKKSGSSPQMMFSISLGEDKLRGIKNVRLSFVLERGKTLKIASEEMDAVVYKRTRGKPKMPGIPLFGDDGKREEVIISYKRVGSKVEKWSETIGSSIQQFDYDDELIFTSYAGSSELRTISDYMGSWRVYNIDALAAKRGQESSDLELLRYGENISPFVARILQEPKTRSIVLRELQEVVPYVDNIFPERLLNIQSLGFSESDSGQKFLLHEMSDGTVRLLGLLAVLRQPVPPAVIVIEEPENALHRKAASVLLDAARAVIRQDFAPQVFVTTHSPVILDDIFNLDTIHDTGLVPSCFIVQRNEDKPNITPLSPAVLEDFENNLGRLSDFWRENLMNDAPAGGR